MDNEPKTDEDWEKIRIGAVSLAEGAYLLKVPRPFTPPGDREQQHRRRRRWNCRRRQITAKVERDPVEWNARIEALRNVALEVLEIVKRKDVDELWDAGEDLDTACENCHRSYWYPGENAEFYQKLRRRMEEFQRQSPKSIDRRGRRNVGCPSETKGSYMRIGSRQMILGAAAIMVARLIGVGQQALAQGGSGRPGASQADARRRCVQERPGAQGDRRRRLPADDGHHVGSGGLRLRRLSSLCRHRPRRLGARHAEKADRAPHGADGDRHQPRQLQRTAGGDLLDLPSRPRSTGETPTLDTVYGEPILEFDDVLTPATGVPTVDQVLNKYLQAIGGSREAGARSPASSPPGRASATAGSAAAASSKSRPQAPDKRATHISFPEYPDRGVSVRTYDGRTGWIATPLAVVPKYELGGSERDGARLDAMLSFPAQIKQALTDLRVGPPTTIDDKDVTVLQGNGPNGTLATLYFDDKSGLLVRQVRHGRSPIGRVPTQVDYSDYRDVGGIKFPVPLDVRLARRPGHFRVQRREAECPD